jgi:glycosyltransferase involved in cell wall biosynthesis
VKIAFVVQRYGTDILGGAEHHCRLVAEKLAARHQVEVLTTCARDYLTWANEYSEGADRIRGVTVRRFATSRTRDMQAFNRLSERVYHERHSNQDEMEWLKQQGPWAPGLVDYLQRHHSTFDVLVFFTYLYAPTVLGIKVAPSKSLLVPTAHDEPPIHLDMYRDVFGSAAAVAWNTEAERRFVSSHFTLRTVVEDVVGCGIDLPEGEAITETDGDAAGEDSLDRRPQFEWQHRLEGADRREPLAPHLEGPANAFRRRHRIHEPFVLYGGRIDPGKGCEELLEYFQTYVREHGDATLMLMGVKMMPLPEDPHVRFAGMLPDEERLHALEAATVVVVPSPHESLSLLALEAMAAGTPVLVNGQADVLVEHCRASNAGLYYADRWEFVEALRLLMRDADLRVALGHNGKTYINRHYRWSSILRKYERLFARIAGPSAAATTERPRDRVPDHDRRPDHPRRSDRDRRPDRGRGHDRGRRFRPH